MRIGLLGAGRIGAFHAGTLASHPDVTDLMVADADPARAARVAAAHPGRARAAGVEEVFAAAPDAVVVASATAAHAGLVARAARAGVPAFCEKPVAVDLPGTLAALSAVESAGAVLQVGFQRRFDTGYAAARRAVRAGRVGTLHTVRMVSSDPAPPPAAYVPLSGGLYRDCLIHDFDILRWVTGREVTEAYACGTNTGADFFRAAGDVDTAAVLLTLEGGALATATATRYHAAGYDVRMEVAGSHEQLAVGTGPRAPLAPMEPAGGGGPWAAPGAEHGGPRDGEGYDGDAYGAGPGGAESPGPGPGRLDGGRPGAGPRRGVAWSGFLERFEPAYRAEIDVFLRVARGAAANPCDGREALRALLVAEACEVSRRERRPVAVAEIEAAAGLAPGSAAYAGAGTAGGTDTRHARADTGPGAARPVDGGVA